VPAVVVGVVGTRVEDLDDIGLVVAGRRHDHRHRADRPQHPQQLTAVQIGQAQVEHDQIGALGQRGLQAVHRRVRGGDGVPALPQRAQQRRPDRRIVLDEQQVGHPRTVSAGTDRNGGLNRLLARPGGSLSVLAGIVGVWDNDRCWWRPGGWGRPCWRCWSGSARST
jgi:hypothetical protein